MKSSILRWLFLLYMTMPHWSLVEIESVPERPEDLRGDGNLIFEALETLYKTWTDLKYNPEYYTVISWSYYLKRINELYILIEHSNNLLEIRDQDRSKFRLVLKDISWASNWHGDETKLKKHRIGTKNIGVQ